LSSRDIFGQNLLWRNFFNSYLIINSLMTKKIFGKIFFLWKILCHR
jgi:hypothetical protein